MNTARASTPRWNSLLWMLAALTLAGCHGAHGGLPAWRASGLSLVPQLGHQRAVMALAMSPDGRLLLSGGDDATVRLWDADAGLLLRVMRGHAAQMRAVAITADGALAASGGSDGTVVVWDARTGAARVRLRPSTAAVWGVAFSTDGARLATVSTDGHLRWWRTADGAPLSDAPHAGSPVNSVAFSPDRARVLVAFENRPQVELWDARDGRVLMTLDGEEESVDNVAMSADGRFAAATSMGHVHHVWSLETGALVQSVRGHHDCLGAALSRDGGMFVTGCAGDVDLWDTRSGQRLRGFGEWDGAIFAAQFSPDDRTLVATSNGTVKIWHLGTDRQVFTFHGPDWGIGPQIGASRDGARVMTRVEGDVRVWDARDFRLIDWRAYGLRTPAAALSGDGRVALSAYQAGDDPVLSQAFTVVRWYPGGPPGERFNGRFRSPPSVAALSGDGARGVLAFGDALTSTLGPEPGTAWVLDLTRAAVSCALTTTGDATAAWMSPDGTRVLLGTEDGWLELFDADSGARLARWDTGEPQEGRSHAVLGLAVSPDGARVASWSYGPRVRVFTLTGASVRDIPLDSNAVGASFTAGGATLSTFEANGTAQDFDLAGGAGRAVSHLAGTFSAPAWLSPDGRQVWAGGETGVMRVGSRADASAITLVGHEGDWLAFGDDGLFDGSRGAGDLVAAVRGNEGFRIDQVAMAANRPDLLFGRMGMASEPSLARWRARVAQRVRRAGLAPSDVDVALARAPRVTLDSAVEQGGYADVTATLDGLGAPIARWNLFVNDVPEFGVEGHAIEGARVQVHARVRLGVGANRIEVSAMGASGLESLRALRVLEGPRSASSPTLYYLGFGVSRYADARLSLHFAHKDALDLEQLFQRADAPSRRVRTRVFTDAEVTRDVFDRAASFLSEATPDDTVVIFVAGHGVHDDAGGGGYYFATYETEVARLSATAASFERLEALLVSTRSRRRLLLLDTCESGERDGPEARVEASVDVGMASRGLRLAPGTAPAAGAAPRTASWDRERYIENDLFRRTGAVVFSASRGEESSFERETLQNGVFTQATLDALSGAAAPGEREVDLRALYRAVSDRVRTLTSERQHPTIDRDNLSAVIRLPVSVGVAP